MKPFVTVRRLRIGVFICAVTSAVSARAGAADIGLIVHVSHAANLKDVVPLLDGTLVDAIPDSDAYLVRVHHLPNAPGLLKEHGVHSVEINRSIALHGFTRPGIFQSKASNPADWYKNQPAFQLIQAGAAAAYSTGRSIVVADINSQVDFSHPALIGHLTSGYDFVSNRRYDDGSLNQSSSGFLDQSSSGFLDQDTVNFLNQSSSGFLDDDMNQPAYSHGTMCAAIIAAISHDAMIMPIRAFDENGGSDVITLAKSIRYAVSHGATVINLSFGTDVDSKSIRDAIQSALDSNIIVNGIGRQQQYDSTAVSRRDRWRDHDGLNRQFRREKHVFKLRRLGGCGCSGSEHHIRVPRGVVCDGIRHLIQRTDSGRNCRSPKVDQT
jgi:subtilisin family serine protease